MLETCPDENVLVAYADRRLPDPERAVLEAHLDACSECLAVVCQVARGEPANPAIDTTLLDAEKTGEEERPVLVRGSVVGRYRIVTLLGEGGMGSVYEAHDPQLDRKVALKLVRAGRLGDAALRARLVREARIMAKLSHPNVVTVFDAGEFGSDFFLAMERVDGVTLAAWLFEQDRPWEEVLRRLLDAGRGLTAAHAAGIVHRDFKPENVLIQRDGRVAVTDFGIALRSVRGPESVRGAHGDTFAGSIVGTPRYMSPEQFRGGLVDARSDQFAFAIVAHEALYGERPFVGDSLEELRRALEQPPMRPPPSGSRIPPRIRSAISRALSADPSARFATLDELLAELSPPAPTPRRHGGFRQGVTVVAILGVALLGIALARAPWSRRPSVPASTAPVVAAVEPSRRPGGRTPVLLGRLDNRSGEPRFEGAVEAVIFDAIDASKRLDPYAAYERAGLAAELGAPTDANGEQLAERLVKRDGGRALVVDARLSPGASGYVLSLRARDVAHETTFDESLEGLATPSDVLGAAIRLTRRLRESYGDKSENSEHTPTEAPSLSLESVSAWAEGRALLRTGDAFAAIPKLREAVRVDPKFVGAHVALGVALSNAMQESAAGEEFALARRDADQLGPRQRLLLHGDDLAASGRYSESIAAYEQLLNDWPGDRDAEVAAAAAAFHAEEWPLAVELSRRAATDHPTAIAARQNLVLAQLIRGAFAETVRDGELALAALPHPPRFMFAHVAAAYALLGQREKALATLARLEVIDPEYADESRADLAFSEGRWRDAEALLERQVNEALARHARPGSSATEYQTLAQIYARRGDFARATRAARAATAEAEPDESLVYAAASVLVLAGHEDEALARTRSWEESASSDLRRGAALLHGDTLLAHRRYKEAIAAYRKVVRESDSWLAHARLGEAFLREHAWADADRELSLCVERRGEAVIIAAPSLHYLPPVYYGLARAKDGESASGAAAAWREFLAIEAMPDGDLWVSEAHARLAALATPSATAAGSR